MNPDTAARIWAWLPARTDSRRVTLPGNIATALSVPTSDVVSELARMERAGHAIRDAARGPMSGWHRGTPIPTPPADDDEPELTLFGPDQ